MPPARTLHRVLALAATGTLAAFGCHPAFDDTREPADQGSFGTTVLTLVCKRFAYNDDLADGGTTDVRGDAYRDLCRQGGLAPDVATGRMKALLAERERLIVATDAIFPAGFLDDLQRYLTANQFLDLYDDQIAQTAIDGLIGFLRLLADDQAATEALERLNHRIGYRPLKPALGAVRAFVGYPELDQLLLTLTTAITEGGTARGEWQRLINATGASLRAAEAPAVADSPDRTLTIALDFLLRERALLGTSATAPVALRDPRGVARPVVPAGAPFVDVDRDGRADIDGLGQFVDAAGQPTGAPPPFAVPDGDVASPWPFRDADGRALTAAGGAPVYAYVDLDASVMTALARDGISLFDPGKGTALDLLRGASALVGARVMATETYGNGETLDYRGYDLSASPLLDLGHAFAQLLRMADSPTVPGIQATLALGRELASNRQPELARLTEAIVTAFRRGDGHPEAVIAAEAPVWDDLIPVFRQIVANPQLFNALLAAMERPEVGQLGARFRNLMSYRDQFNIDPLTLVVSGSFATPVDRTRVDSNYDRSVFQRFLHLIADSNGAEACNKQGAQVKDPFLGITLGTYNRCALFRVPNLAVFYLQSMAYAKNAAGQYLCETAAGAFGDTIPAATPEGCVAAGRQPRPKANFNYNWGTLVRTSLDTFGGDEFLEDTVAIPGARTFPTPSALNRILFVNPTPAQCDADDERPGCYLLDIIAPLRDREGDLYGDQHAGTLPVLERDNFYAQIRPVVQAFADANAEQLFVDLLVAMHKHWASRQSTNHQSVSPTSPNYVWGSDAGSYEPLIADLLADGTLLGALTATAPVLNRLTVPVDFTGTPAADATFGYPAILRTAALYLLSPQPGLADRTGRATSTRADGVAIAQVSPWHLLADAYRGKHTRVAAAGPEGEAWGQSVSELVDVLLRGADVSGTWRWKNPRTRGVLDAALELVAGRVRAHDAAGDRARWLATDLTADIQDLVTSPVFAGAADFIVSLQASPETRVQLDQLLQYLVSEAQASESFVAALTAVADVAQLALDDRDLVPIMHVLGEAVRPERGWLDAHLTFVKGARAADTSAALSRIMVNLYSEDRPGRTAVGDLVDGLCEILRARPDQDRGQRLTADDYRAVLTGVADFLDEEKRGLRKFIAIIESREQ